MGVGGVKLVSCTVFHSKKYGGRKTESERKKRKYQKRKAFKTRKPIKHNLTFFQFTLPFHFSELISSSIVYENVIVD